MNACYCFLIMYVYLNIHLRIEKQNWHDKSQLPLLILDSNEDSLQSLVERHTDHIVGNLLQSVLHYRCR